MTSLPLIFAADGRQYRIHDFLREDLWIRGGDLYERGGQMRAMLGKEDGERHQGGIPREYRDVIKLVFLEWHFPFGSVGVLEWSEALQEWMADPMPLILSVWDGRYRLVSRAWSMPKQLSDDVTERHDNPLFKREIQLVRHS